MIQIRGNYRVLLKTIRPELEQQKAVFLRARKAAKTERSKALLWNRCIQIRYGIVISLSLRVEEAIQRCDILLGLQDHNEISKSSNEAVSVENTCKPATRSSIVSAPQPDIQPTKVVAQKKKTSGKTARQRIERRLKKKKITFSL